MLELNFLIDVVDTGKLLYSVVYTDAFCFLNAAKKTYAPTFAINNVSLICKCIDSARINCMNKMYFIVKRLFNIYLNETSFCVNLYYLPI